MIDYSKVEATIDLEAIRNNYRILKSMGSNVAAVIKADAYGHGIVEVAEAVLSEGCDTFAVGTVEEGAKLRRAGIQGRIISLLGPVDDGDYPLLSEYSIIPFVGGFDQLERVGRAATPVDICLKFDTGMSRLGFSLYDLDRIYAMLLEMDNVTPVMASSHLATSDEPDNFDYVQKQGEIFQEIITGLVAKGYGVDATLANSAAILAHENLHHQYQRAGIALYGCNPFAGTELAERGSGLRPAMSVGAPVVGVRRLEPGQSISYGCTFTAEKEMTAAIVAIGYADGYSRGLGNRAQMCIKGRRVPVIGRVCMQLTAVDVSGIPVTEGDTAYVLGGPGENAVTPEELAFWWNTITYELFCLLGMNRRTYLNI